MTRTRRLALIAAGTALVAGATLGAGGAQADPLPVTALRSDYIACAGVDGASGICVEDPSPLIRSLPVPQPRQLVYDLTGIG